MWSIFIAFLICVEAGLNRDVHTNEVRSSVDPEPRAVDEPSESSIDLYWIPLGAGGAGFVRLNGRIYETIRARLERRQSLDLYHTALEVRTQSGRFTVENAWPSPDADTASRGAAVEGPVFSRRIARFRPFRYEVRRWLDGVIPDAGEAVASPQTLSHDATRARRLLELVASVPPLIWGRDELETGEMWNSNSVTSWLLSRCGLPVDEIQFPPGGSAPGWMAGMVIAKRNEPTPERTRSTCGDTVSSGSPSTQKGRK